MKKCYLDTNILLCFTNPKAELHEQAIELISLLLIKEWTLFISALILDEYFHNSLRFSRVSKENAFQDLRRGFSRIKKLKGLNLVHSPDELKKQAKVLSLMFKYQLRSRDAYHLFIMLENRIKFMATFDLDFQEVFRQGLIKQFT